MLGLIDARKFAEAEQAAHEVLARFPGVHDGYECLGPLYQAKGDHHQATECYRKVIAFARNEWFGARAGSWVVLAFRGAPSAQLYTISEARNGTEALPHLAADEFALGRGEGGGKVRSIGHSSWVRVLCRAVNPNPSGPAPG